MLSKGVLSQGVLKALLILLLCATSGVQAAEAFEFKVVRHKYVGTESGLLTIDDEGIRYQSDKEKTAMQFTYVDIRRVNLSKPSVIRLQAYDRLKRKLTRHRSYKFRLKEGVTDSRVARFLIQRLERPLVGFYELVGESFGEIPVYHRHRLRGCHGVLRIAEEGIQFVSEKSKDSRSWLYRDVETIGTSRPFNLRVSSFVETYTFDLKDRLPVETYRLLWQRIHGMQNNQRQKTDTKPAEVSPDVDRLAYPK